MHEKTKTGASFKEKSFALLMDQDYLSRPQLETDPRCRIVLSLKLGLSEGYTEVHTHLFSCVFAACLVIRKANIFPDSCFYHDRLFKTSACSLAPCKSAYSFE